MGSPLGNVAGAVGRAVVAVNNRAIRALGKQAPEPKYPNSPGIDGWPNPNYRGKASDNSNVHKDFGSVGSKTGKGK